MSNAAFTVGQRVAVIRDDNSVDGVHAVARITHNGTRIFIEGRPRLRFNRYGRETGLRIVPATAEHEAALERSQLFARIDAALGTYTGHNIQKARRARIQIWTLRSIVRLLDLPGEEPPSDGA